MKLFFITLIFALSLIFVFANAQSSTNDEDKKEKAFKECNSTNPVQRDPRQVIASMIIYGDKTNNLTQEDKSHLYCFLQKVKFVNENGTMHGPGVVNYTLRNAPELVSFSDVLIAQIFQITKSTEDIEDKSEKTFVTYYKFSENIFTLAIANGLSSNDPKDKAISLEMQAKIEKYLKFIDDATRNIPQSSLFTRIAQSTAFKIITGVCLACIQ